MPEILMNTIDRFSDLNGILFEGSWFEGVIPAIVNILVEDAKVITIYTGNDGVVKLTRAAAAVHPSWKGTEERLV